MSVARRRSGFSCSRRAMHLRWLRSCQLSFFQDRTLGCRVMKVRQILFPEEGALHRSIPRRSGLLLRCASEVSYNTRSSERVIASWVVGQDVSRPTVPQA